MEVGRITLNACDRMCWNAVSEILSQIDGSQNGVPELFSNIDISNTSQSLTEFLVTMRSEIYFR
jgi:hypothetical protein